MNKINLNHIKKIVPAFAHMFKEENNKVCIGGFEVEYTTSKCIKLILYYKNHPTIFSTHHYIKNNKDLRYLIASELAICFLRAEGINTERLIFPS